jgi:thiol-disulfide isomerase/thioredoxin
MPAKHTAKHKPGNHPAPAHVTPHKADHLVMFHGTECPHCRNMDPLVEQAERELHVKVTKLEVWHNAKNAELLESIDRGMCGGVPFFWNTKSKKWICGETDYDTLRDWAGSG